MAEKIHRKFAVKSAAIAWVLDILERWNWEKPIVISIDEMRRHHEQSQKFHAMLNDISRQIEWDGQMRTPEQWKNLLVSGHTVATKNEVELVRGIEGEILNIRESTSTMTVRRMASLIEYTQAWAASNGVQFKLTDDEDRYYQSLPEARR